MAVLGSPSLISLGFCDRKAIFKDDFKNDDIMEQNSLVQGESGVIARCKLDEQTTAKCRYLQVPCILPVCERWVL